ncbi:amidase [Zhouia sp. CL16]|nr:amidase [Zhouia amylolytica]
MKSNFMKSFIAIALFSLCLACKTDPKQEVSDNYEESTEILEQQEHPNKRMRYKLIQSRYKQEEPWQVFDEKLDSFPVRRYEELKSSILGRSIIQIQASVANNEFSYEELTLFYLYRIRYYEGNPLTSLHSIIELNPEAIALAREMDLERKSDKNHEVYGIPVLLKDNIGASGLHTTAGAVALAENMPEDAVVTRNLKAKGAIILGKVNLSEWAYFFCDGCPLGYSAIGGQTLNPYGRKVFETGGSSSGSGVVVATNYAVGAVGTETAGSILSPSGQNSVVGLKPTVGVLSQNGIVPISSTLDTPGPMTGNVMDNFIIFDAMKDVSELNMGLDVLQKSTLKGKRFGVFKDLVQEDSLYSRSVGLLKENGAVVIEVEAPKLNLDGFITLLNIDMKNDLPAYLEANATEGVAVKTIEEVVDFNLKDSIVRVPYNQKLFEGIISDTTTSEQLEDIKIDLESKGRSYFNSILDTHDLDAVLSINNYHAAFAAVAKYPALIVPMGYKVSGEPVGLTFISKPFQEMKLYELGGAYERINPIRELPKNYQ